MSYIFRSELQQPVKLIHAYSRNSFRLAEGISRGRDDETVESSFKIKKGRHPRKECRPLCSLIEFSVGLIILRGPRNQATEGLPARKHHIILHADIASIGCDRRSIEAGLGFVTG